MLHKGTIFLTFCLSMPAWAGADDPPVIAPYTITDGRSIDDPLAGAEGVWQTGRLIYFDRKLTGCSGCHGSPGGPGAEIVAGNEGAPALSGIGSRMSPGEIRLWIAAPVAIDPETAMPAFYLAGQRRDGEGGAVNGPWLSAQQIEHLVAYLSRQTDTQ
ncbi:MAG: c-type cytochrome [Pseudomonadota bacterium]